MSLYGFYLFFVFLCWEIVSLNLTVAVCRKIDPECHPNVNVKLLDLWPWPKESLLW